jgi:carbon-monoxide dehydrogenase small subunit
MQVSMTVNGKMHTVEIEPRLLLVDFIRDTVGLKGTKVGCDTGECGSCTLLVNNQAMKSCSMLAAQADGSAIRTIEDVDSDGQLSPLQQGLWEMHGVQCGFCTPGVIMSLLDLLQQNSDPSEEEIRSWLGGNLCRCTGYLSIVRAVRYMVEKAQEPVVELTPVTAD